MHQIRINLANPQELGEIPGLDSARMDRIVRHRAEHGPIHDAVELARILGEERLPDTLLSHIDFAPSDTTAPEAPGA